jgi:hypothetical protein
VSAARWIAFGALLLAGSLVWLLVGRGPASVETPAEPVHDTDPASQEPPLTAPQSPEPAPAEVEPPRTAPELPARVEVRVDPSFGGGGWVTWAREDGAYVPLELRFEDPTRGPQVLSTFQAPGTYPLDREFPAGTHRFRVYLSDGRIVDTALELASGSTGRLDVR